MIALIVIIALVALFLVLLCIPVQLALEANLTEERRFNVSLVWFFGLLRLSLKRRKPRPARAQKPKEKAKMSPRDRWRRLQMVLSIIRIKGLARQTIRLFARLLKTIKFLDAAIDLKLGLGDPADTGMLFAFIGPFTPLIRSYAPFPVSLQPLMDDSWISGYSRGRISVQPVRLGPPILGFLFSRPAFRLIRVMLAQRWKKRR